MNKEVYSKIYESARHLEYEHAQEFIANIENELSGCPLLLNIFAPKGFGKLAFLEQIWEDYELYLPTSLINVDRFLNPAIANDFVAKDLLKHIISEFGERLPSRNFPLPPDYMNWTSEEDLAALLMEGCLRAEEYGKVSLILINNYDLMPKEHQHWFQKEILNPAIRSEKVAIVLTSETQLRFTESFELRMRLESRKLNGFDADTISHALPEFEWIAGDIHKFTGGLPKLVGAFTDQLKESHVTTLADFKAHAQELTLNYYPTYVEEGVLADLPTDIQETLFILALLQRFDIKILKKILPDLIPESYRDYSTPDYLDLIDRLQPWVEWRREGGYTLNPALQLMLQGYILTIKPDLYHRVSRTAEDKSPIVNGRNL